MALRFLVALAACGVLLAACTPDTVVVQGAPRPVATTEPPATTAAPTSTSAPTTTAPPAAVSTGLAVIPPGGVPVFAQAGGDAEYFIHEGVLLGFAARDSGFLEVVTTCNDTMWVRERDVEVIPRSRNASAPGATDVAQATIVVDPGHGSRDWGGVGPTGLAEKEANLDISDRVRRLLESSHDVDWVTGLITPGTSVPAAAAVWLTRDPAGPSDGDYELGLAYRSHIANSAGADVFVSIHNNTVPTSNVSGPGSDVFYAWSVAQSDRLASLIHQELLRSFRSFEADWKGGLILGARARIDPDTETDYYGILRRAEMPAVIVEGAYISEPEEEALLRTAAFRQAYADGVYRGIVRFLTTEQFGEKVNDPELFTSDAGTVNTSACQVPEQP